MELYATQRYLTVTGRPVLSGLLVPLKGFGEVANLISPPHLQRSTEDDRSHLPFSSVGIPSPPAHTLPEQEGQRNKCLFELARWIKGVNPKASREELRRIVQTWHQAAARVIGTKDFAVTWSDFGRGWEKVEQPYGMIMNSIVQSIDFGTPLPHSVRLLGYGSHCEHLVRVCLALEKHHHPEPFFISARQAGDILRVHFTDASKMLSCLVADEVLQLVSKGVGNKASRYRVKGSRSETGLDLR